MWSDELVDTRKCDVMLKLICVVLSKPYKMHNIRHPKFLPCLGMFGINHLRFRIGNEFWKLSVCVAEKDEAFSY